MLPLHLSSIYHLQDYGNVHFGAELVQELSEELGSLYKKMQISHVITRRELFTVKPTL